MLNFRRVGTLEADEKQELIMELKSYEKIRKQSIDIYEKREQLNFNLEEDEVIRVLNSLDELSGDEWVMTEFLREKHNSYYWKIYGENCESFLRVTLQISKFHGGVDENRWRPLPQVDLVISEDENLDSFLEEQDKLEKKKKELRESLNKFKRKKALLTLCEKLKIEIHCHEDLDVDEIMDVMTIRIFRQLGELGEIDEGLSVIKKLIEEEN